MIDKHIKIGGFNENNYAVLIFINNFECFYNKCIDNYCVFYQLIILMFIMFTKNLLCFNIYTYLYCGKIYHDIYKNNNE